MTPFYNSGSQNGRNNGSHKKKKSDYCWNYNKGLKCRFGAKCRFIERCSYCDSGAHNLTTCPKAKKDGADAQQVVGNNANVSNSNSSK